MFKPLQPNLTTLLCQFDYLIPWLQAELTKQQNDFKIALKTLEDDLLSRLSSAGGTVYSSYSMNLCPNILHYTFKEQFNFFISVKDILISNFYFKFIIASCGVAFNWKVLEQLEFQS